MLSLLLSFQSSILKSIIIYYLVVIQVTDLNIFVTFEVFSFDEELSHNLFQQNPKLSIDIRNEIRVTFDFVETCNGLMLNTDNYTPELFSLTMTVTKEGKKTFTLKCIFKVIFVDQKVHVPKCKHSSTVKANFCRSKLQTK